MGRKRGRTAKGARAKQAGAPGDAASQPACHSFIIHQGRLVGAPFDLIRDLRKVMQPNTAAELKVKKSNVFKDFAAVAGPFGVSHIIVLTKPSLHINLHIVRMPRGPTLAFKVQGFSLMRDVVSALRKPSFYAEQFLQPPLVVMNNFVSSEMQVKVMATVFQNMFPPINVNKVKLNSVRRCVLFNYGGDEDKTVEFRHYNIKVVPKGIGRGVKKLIQSKVPNMSKFSDISEYVLGGGNVSESDGEFDGDHNQVILPQPMSSRGNQMSQQSAIRLTELGPRMKLLLFKIQEGTMDGKVLFHGFLKKTEEEKILIDEKLQKRKRVKEQRKKLQEANVRMKLKEKEDHKKRSLRGMMKPREEGNDGASEGGSEREEEEEDDDAQYFEKEVGEKPDPDLFPEKAAAKRKASDGEKQRNVPSKRGKWQRPGETSERHGGGRGRGQDRGRGGGQDRGRSGGRGDGRSEGRGRGRGGSRGSGDGRRDPRSSKFDSKTKASGKRGKAPGKFGRGGRGRGGGDRGSRRGRGGGVTR